MRISYDVIDGRIAEVHRDDAPIVIFQSPTDAEREYLVKEMLVDEHTLQSALDMDEISRLEFEPNHVAIILKRPANYTNDIHVEFRVASIGAFLFHDRLLIVQSDDSSLWEGRRPFANCQSLPGSLLRLMYFTIDHFLGHLKVIHLILDEIERKIQKSLGNKALSNMFALEKSLVYYQSAVQSNGLVLAKLRQHVGRVGFNDEETEFLDDIMVENDQCAKLVDIYSSILTGMSDARVSIVSNNLAILMKKLTVISVGIVPVNVVASMGGMSEFSAWTRHIWWPYSYGAFGLAMIIIAYMTFVLMQRMGMGANPNEDD
ncbi:magnesium transporter CorA family protein [Candidatus Sumerlaeota bacterium]|nr:magnesium transporter CorA family protein [Candidatus Sumerlaeales bacterium]NLD61955.1 magnesium transporter CorA family protein [Candidatus Sumerlaeota bacterium]